MQVRVHVKLNKNVQQTHEQNQAAAQEQTNMNQNLAGGAVTEINVAAGSTSSDVIQQQRQMRVLCKRKKIVNMISVSMLKKELKLVAEKRSVRKEENLGESLKKESLKSPKKKIKEKEEKLEGSVNIKSNKTQ